MDESATLRGENESKESNKIKEQGSVLSWLDQYRRLGFNLIPCKPKSKQPAVFWREYQGKKSTPDEHRLWFIETKHNTAVVLGKISNNLVCIDIDSKAVVRKLENWIQNLRAVTMVVGTHRGVKVFLRSEKLCDNFTIRTPEGNIEIHTRSRFELIPPSIHPEGTRYEHLGRTDQVLEVENIEAEIWEVLKKAFNIKRPVNQFESKKKELKDRPYDGEDPPCIKTLLQGVEQGFRNEAGIRLVAYWLHFKGLSKEEAGALLLNWNQRNRPPLPERELKNILESALKLERSYGCDKMQPWCELEKCPLKSEQRDQKKVIYTPFMELPDGRLIEEAFDGENIFFLVYDPKTDRVEKRHEIELENRVIKPIDSDDIRNKIVLLPSGIEEYRSDEKLKEEILKFLDKWHEAPDSLSRMLDVFYAFLTYIQDLLPQVPYRRYLAPWGRGKSAWLDTLGSICYRPIILAGSDTDKSIVRKIHIWRGTALIDEADFSNSNFFSFIVKILNIGYDRRKGYYQRSDDNNPFKTISYYVFGCKLLATRSRFKDIALESRCITTIGRQNTKPMPLFRMDTFEEEAQQLRNKLILWRFKNYHKVKEQVRKLEDPSIADEIYADGNLSSRVKQVTIPLWLTAGDEIKEDLTKLAKSFDAQLKTGDPSYQLELQAQEAIRKIIGEYENQEELRSRIDIIKDDSTRYWYAIPLSLISRKVLAIKGVEQITRKDIMSTSKGLMNVFETRLGFRVEIGKYKRRMVIIPKDWIKEKDIHEKLLVKHEAGGLPKDIPDITNVPIIQEQSPSAKIKIEKLPLSETKTEKYEKQKKSKEQKVTQQTKQEKEELECWERLERSIRSPLDKAGRVSVKTLNQTQQPQSTSSKQEQAIQNKEKQVRASTEEPLTREMKGKNKTDGYVMVQALKLVPKTALGFDKCLILGERIKLPFDLATRLVQEGYVKILSNTQGSECIDHVERATPKPTKKPTETDKRSHEKQEQREKDNLQRIQLTPKEIELINALRLVGKSLKNKFRQLVEQGRIPKSQLKDYVEFLNSLVQETERESKALHPETRLKLLTGQITLEEAKGLVGS